MHDIVLTTLNARYAHSSIGLRYLYANLHELQSHATILEFSINEPIQRIAEQILDVAPKIVGIGVYIWNATEVKSLIHILKKVMPQMQIVLGGPEVTYLPDRVDFSEADFIVRGEGELAFYELAQQLLKDTAPAEHVLPMRLPKIDEIVLPYAHYSDEDIAHRYIYVEASRGCPYLCEFCLSSLDEKVRYFDLESLLGAFETLWQRGARNFKFIDRTFNLNIKFANALLDFFLSKEAPYFVHFEVIPDHFPESVKERMKAFPAGSLQLEIGIQTLNEEVADRISRPLRLEKITENITFFEHETTVHMHLDLIIGLPGESLESFGKNLDTLCSLTHAEIQVGILKKLAGTTIDRHDKAYAMVYSDEPPYDILCNDRIDYATMQEMKRFARYWDLVYNSGNFRHTVALLKDDGKIYAPFRDWSRWLYAQTAATGNIALERLAQLLFTYLQSERGIDAEVIAEAMLDDWQRSGRKISPFLRPFAKESSAPSTDPHTKATKRQQLRSS